MSEELMKMMNTAVAMELQVSIQYMWQHILWKGVEGFVVKDELKKIAIEEMKHAEAIAERMSYLGGRPDPTPMPVHVGESLKEMIAQDKKDEEATIKLYREIIKKANEEDDVTTARLFRKILEDEEEHHDFFSSLFE